MICQNCGSQMVETESSVSCPECHPRLSYRTVPCGITTQPCPECAQITERVRLLERVAVTAVRYYQVTKKHAPYTEKGDLNKALENAGY